MIISTKNGAVRFVESKSPSTSLDQRFNSWRIEWHANSARTCGNREDVRASAVRIFTPRNFTSRDSRIQMVNWRNQTITLKSSLTRCSALNR